VIHADTLIKNPSYKEKLSKYIKKEGKAYIVKDGDIISFSCKIK
jgi:ribosome-binding ATPase YchF (GTP1/OBG family)